MGTELTDAVVSFRRVRWRILLPWAADGEALAFSDV
jgi:hypothetical protein